MKKEKRNNTDSPNSETLYRVGNHHSGKHFFTGVYGKYISAFAVIVFISFLMLAGIVTGVVRNYAFSSKAKLAVSTVKSAEQYLESRLQEDDISNLSEFVLSNRQDLNALLSAICNASEDDLAVFLTDTNGKILYFVNRDKDRLEPGAGISVDLVQEVISGVEISKMSDIDGLFEEQHLVRAASLETNGVTVGTVFVCSSSEGFTSLLNLVVKTILLSSIWVTVAALVAIYFITGKITGPLREMSRAAKAFAAGNFEVSVPVRGNDEVAELAVAFNNMAFSLKNLEKMRSTFMANVSHDLRTPMTTIGGFIDSILAGAIPPEKQSHYLELVSGEVKRLSRLVSLTLDISRIQAGDRKFTMAQFDICEMARQILISFEQKIDGKHLDVDFDADEDNIPVYADRDAIYQVLYNICDNAVKFSKEGGKLAIGIRMQREKKVLVSVYNEGQGIPKEDLPYVFDQFYKGDKSRGLDKSGVGLGMYISKTIMDAHREEIWVQSEYGKNCEFGFTLSAKPPQHQKGTDFTQTV